ncbi:unnamed protein product, partial [Ectocarpus sp. 13 AM-2016]
ARNKAGEEAPQQSSEHRNHLLYLSFAVKLHKYSSQQYVHISYCTMQTTVICCSLSFPSFYCSLIVTFPIFASVDRVTRRDPRTNTYSKRQPDHTKTRSEAVHEVFRVRLS